jgi:hypothetical protein
MEVNVTGGELGRRGMDGLHRSMDVLEKLSVNFKIVHEEKQAHINYVGGCEYGLRGDNIDDRLIECRLRHDRHIITCRAQEVSLHVMS